MSPQAPHEEIRKAPHDEIRKLERFAHWLDDRFRVPGTNIRFGLDSLIGLVPGVGDSATAVSAAYLVLRAHRLGAPTHLLGRMAGNILIDMVVGAIPLLGDIFDVGFKANRRNIELLKRHVQSGPA